MPRPTGSYKRRRRAIPARVLKRKTPLISQFNVKHWILFQEKLFRQYDFESKKNKFYCLQLAVRFALILEQT